MSLKSLLQYFSSFEERSRARRLLTESPNWPEVVADVLDWAVVDAEVQKQDTEEHQVRGTLAFTLANERHYGLVYSVPIKKYEAREIVSSGKLPTKLAVRYNPDDPDETMTVPRRNDLPFEIRMS